MASPIGTDIKVNLGSSGTPTNDTDPIGGSPVDTDLVDSTPNLYFDDTPAPAFGSANIVHYNKISRRCKVGRAANGKIIGWNLLRDNPAGTITFTAGASDAGKKVLCQGVASGVLAVGPDNITTLVDGSATGLYSFDAAEFWRAELLASDGVTPVAAVDEIVISRGGTILGRIPPSSYMATREYALAVATAINTALSAADRLHAPTGIGAFSAALNTDGGVACPADLIATDNGGAGGYIDIALRKTLRAGLPAPKLGYVPLMHDFQFDSAEI